MTWKDKFKASLNTPEALERIRKWNLIKFLHKCNPKKYYVKINADEFNPSTNFYSVTLYDIREGKYHYLMGTWHNAKI